MKTVQSEIDDLLTLEQNWDSYDAPPINRQIIEAAHKLVSNIRPAVDPRIVPTSNGSIQLEWHIGEKCLELEFESPDIIRYLLWCTIDVNEEDVISATSLDFISDLIRRFESDK